jgi:hypothetical protein
MAEFATLDRCAAYVAARATLVAVQRISRRWPEGLADRMRRAAVDAMQRTADAISHGHGTVGRRRRVRDALTGAICVAELVDLARAMGLVSVELDALQRLAGRSVALLGMLLHASTTVFPDLRPDRRPDLRPDRRPELR